MTGMNAQYNVRSHSMQPSTSSPRPGACAIAPSGCHIRTSCAGARAIAGMHGRPPCTISRRGAMLQGKPIRMQKGRRRQGHHIQALFTGIVQGMGQVTRVQEQPDFRSIDIQFPTGSMDSIQIGASVAINGTCLTVTQAHGDRLTFDIIVETLRATNLGALREGTAVNFERSARVGDEIGGHNVSGHVCTTATLASIEESANNRRLTFQVPERWMKYVLPKGFIAVDGISLTVGEVGPDRFAVYLIPETLRVTTLGGRAEGDAVNLEVEAQTQCIAQGAASLPAGAQVKGCAGMVVQAIVDTVESVVARYMAERVPA